jgi:hypothetical protein
MSNNKHKHKLTDLRKFASTLGLEIAKYSPGDGRTRYKIVDAGRDYWSTDGWYRPATLSEAHAFMAGFERHRYLIARLQEGGAQ